jgi:hypothetical protein
MSDLKQLIGGLKANPDEATAGAAGVGSGHPPTARENFDLVRH